MRINSQASAEQKSEETTHGLKELLLSMPITAWMILANISMYIFTASLGNNIIIINKEILFLFGISGYSISEGWIWTLVTAMFAHYDILHLTSNMIFLAAFGMIYEREIGRRYYLVIYLLAGLSANILSLSIFPYTITIGSSAAIFGIAGAVIIRYLESLVFGALFMIILFALTPAMSFLGHGVGGFVGVLIDRAVMKTQVVNEGTSI